MTEFDTELDLLLRLVRPSGPGRERVRLDEQTRSSPDWERVFELACYHGLLPLVHRGLQRVNGDTDVSVPDSFEARLREVAREKTIENLRYADQLHRIMDTFDGNGVRALPFKGPVLSAFAYGSVAQRHFNDLDILVHPEDVSTAVDLLESLGYIWRDGTPRLDDAALLGGPVTKSLVSEYYLHGPIIDVEVRWRLGDPERPFPIAFEDLWRRRDTVSVAGRTLETLSPVDRILYLAYHGTKHNWFLLKWICDFAGALEATNVEWTDVLARARETGVERMLLLGAGLAATLFGSDLPGALDRRLTADARVSVLVQQVVDRLTDGTPSEPGRVDLARFFFQASDSITSIVPIVLYESALHPTYGEYRFWPLPGPLHALYYLIWPVRVLTERVIRPLRAGPQDVREEPA